MQHAIRFKSILILTYGRSGSTLLQGLLNSIPGCLVRGENFNFCHSLFQAWRALHRAKAQHGGPASGQQTHPWFGARCLDPEAFLEDLRPLVRRQLLGDADPAAVSCLGFKEIRYPGLPDIAAFLDFLALLFPKAAFIQLTREHSQVARSAWWRTLDPTEVEAALTGVEQAIASWGEGRQDYFRIDYSDMVSEAAALIRLFEFVGGGYDSKVVHAVLATPHSYPSPPLPAPPASA